MFSGGVLTGKSASLSLSKANTPRRVSRDFNYQIRSFAIQSPEILIESCTFLADLQPLTLVQTTPRFLWNELHQEDLADTCN